MTSQLRTTAPRDCHCSAQLRPPLKGLPSRATACRYVYTGPGGVSSLATDPSGTPVAPCKIRSFTSIQMVHTHTPGRSRVNPERQKEEKSGHTRRAKGQDSAGGGRERTDLQNQPTRRNGPDKKQSTHLNPTTHYGEAQAEN